MRKNWSASAQVLTALWVLGLAAVTQPVAFSREVKIEDQALIVAFESHSGALTRLVDKTGRWTIERRPELGVSFRLFAPLPERRYNPVLGQKQRAAEVKKLSGHQLRLQWQDLASENGGVLPITLTAIVSLTNGVITFDATLQNDSTLTVETIDYPYLGDCQPPSRSATLFECVLRNRNSGEFRSDEIYPHFHNEKGYWGVFYPTTTREAQDSPFCLVQAPDKGLCVGLGADTAPYRLQYTFEQHPGLLSSVTSLVPAEDKIAGTPVHLEFRTCHFIFAAPHTRVQLAPIILSAYQGDAQAGLAFYRQWRRASAR